MWNEALVAGLCVIVFGTLNNVLGRIKAKPLGAFNIFASLANAVAYIAAYAAILAWRRGGHFLKKSERDFLRSPRVDTYGPVSPSEAPLLAKREPPTPPISKWKPQGWRRRSGPRWHLFVWIGAFDAVGSVMGLIAQPAISGPTYSIALQCIVLFSAVIGFVFLGDRYTKAQIGCIAVVVTGACISCLSPAASHPPAHTPGQIQGLKSQLPNLPAADAPGVYGQSASLYVTVLFASVAALSTLPTASTFAIRDYLMREYKTWVQHHTHIETNTYTHTHTHPHTHIDTIGIGTQQSNNQKLDIFVVGLLASTATACALPIVLLAQYFIRDQKNLIENIADGFRCLIGHSPGGDEIVNHCKFAPFAYLAYISANLCFNFSLLWMVQKTNALSTFLCVKAVLPISILIYGIVPLPLLENADSHVSTENLAGLALVLVGLSLYAREKIRTS